ncbi:hypothetical protein [Enterovibrio coralii]|uniref:Uncharacterized protein n=1 Tax=Enterovibrio coralii TaxID=294935 RepID=A0A135I6X3_9GAMM|nr:hypothetical protein [Enterovibrio coralii]KXF81201.1 hypothetical protein ATN88_00050 [Enterovibrio coralii]
MGWLHRWTQRVQHRLTARCWGVLFQLEAQANAERAASENATLNQQARIDAANQEAKESKDAARRQQLMLFGGGALVVLIALYIIFRK